MYRDESETHLDDGHSHNFATAFMRNLRCSAVMSINVWACQTVMTNHLTGGPPVSSTHGVVQGLEVDRFLSNNVFAFKEPTLRPHTL